MRVLKLVIVLINIAIRTVHGYVLRSESRTKSQCED